PTRSSTTATTRTPTSARRKGGASSNACITRCCAKVNASRPRRSRRMSNAVVLIAGAKLADYGFPNGHPFGSDRYGAFMAELERSVVAPTLVRKPPRQATRAELEYFHTPAYVDRVIELSKRGSGLLDAGDTPAFPGVYEAAAHVVGGTLEALAAIVAGPARRAFIPIGGLHHAARDVAAG